MTSMDVNILIIVTVGVMIAVAFFTGMKVGKTINQAYHGQYVELPTKKKDNKKVSEEADPYDLLRIDSEHPEKVIPTIQEK